MPSSRSRAYVFKVGLMILAPAVVLALVLGKGMLSAVGSGSLDQAERQTQVAAQALGQRGLARAAADRRPSRAQRKRVDAVLARLTSSGDVVSARVIDSKGRVAYSAKRGERGGTLASTGLSDALAGTGKAERRSVNGQQVIDSYVPLRSRAAGKPVAALQLQMKAGPIESAAAANGKRLYLIFLAGLAVICAGLLRYVTRASSHFRDKAAEHEEQALRDPLTGLPNRALFNKIVDRALADCPPGGLVSVLLMDLDRFKEINDSLGHFNGDLVIERVGKRLTTVLREGDVVARLGGDEFAMLLPTLQARDSVVGAIKRVQDALEEPFTAGGLALRVEASVGAALYPQDGDTGGNLLRAADVAMYAAKKAHCGHKFYAPEQHQYTPARLGLVAQLSRAMEEGELVLHYQPKARLGTGTVEGVEALARWNHPQRGLLYPDEFIPVTEHTSMIRPVTIHLLKTALEQVRVWKAGGLELTVAVNLSAQTLLDLELPKEIGRMLSRAGLPARSLEVEITESAIMSDPRRAEKILGRLREMGVGVAIDDFGTGYSSLVSLKRLPVSTIKIDKSFVMNMESDRDDSAIVRSTVSLGRNMGLEVVAEGVETAGAWNQLKEMGADFAQGYHLSKPLAPDQFDRWLGAYREMFGADRPTSPPRPAPEVSLSTPARGVLGSTPLR